MKGRFRIQFVFIFLVGLLNFSATTSDTHTITVKITNIRNAKGQMNVQLFRTKESFEDEKCWKEWNFKKGDKVENNTMTCVIPNIPGGVYGIAILDDEDMDLKMNYRMLIPKEGFGFSNYYHTAWSKPKYDSFKFTLNKDTNVSIKVRYV